MRKVIKGYIKLGLNLMGCQVARLNYDDRKLYQTFYPKRSIENTAFYHVGTGGHGTLCVIDHPYWTNIDLDNRIFSKLKRSQKHHIYDMLRKEPLPIEDNSAEIIMSRFAVEHVNDEAALFFLKEARRALKPNGILRIITPNAELDFWAYQNKDWSFFSWIGWMSRNPELYGHKIPINQASFEQVFLSHFAANVSEIHVASNTEKFSNEEIKEVVSKYDTEEAIRVFTSRCSIEVQKKYRRNHISGWTHKKLTEALKAAGFKNSIVLGPGQSIARVLKNEAYFDNLWNGVAFYMEAIK